MDSTRLEGRNAVLEALNHGAAIDKIFVKKGEFEGTLRLIVAKAKSAGLVVTEVNKNKLDMLSETGSHQGVIALCPAKKYVEVEDILALAREKGEAPFIIVLDGITDPHNLGAIIRTAEGAGAHGIIIPKRRAAGLTGIVSKASAGAIEHVSVAKVTNTANLLRDLKKEGLWIACGDLSGQELHGADLSGPIALVIGGEGAGVGRIVKEQCDFTVKIPMYGKISSLNASVAAGILMYEIVRQRSMSL